MSKLSSQSILHSGKLGEIRLGIAEIRGKCTSRRYYSVLIPESGNLHRMLRPLRLISRSKNLKANGYKTFTAFIGGTYFSVNVDMLTQSVAQFFCVHKTVDSADEVVVKTILAAIPELRNLLVPLATLKLLKWLWILGFCGCGSVNCQVFSSLFFLIFGLLLPKSGVFQKHRAGFFQWFTSVFSSHWPQSWKRVITVILILQLEIP